MHRTIHALKVPLSLYLLFVAWVFFVALFISRDTAWSLNEIKSQWVMGSFVMALGAVTAALANDRAVNPKTVLMIIFWALAFHVLCIDIDGMITVFSRMRLQESYPGLTFLTTTVGGLTIGPIDASLLTSVFFTLIFAEFLFRVIYKKWHMPFGNRLLFIFFILAALGFVLTGMRNIIDTPAIILAGVIVMCFSANAAARKKAFIISLLLLPLLFSFVLFAYKSDSRWGELQETLALVINDGNSGKALADHENFDYPEMSDSKPVNVSNFLRFAKYKMGVDIARTNPLGLGFGRNAFGRYMQQTYNTGTGLNSDSSLMDITVGSGVVGGVIFICFFLSILTTAFRYFRGYSDYFSMLLFLLAVCFGARLVFDSIFRDHLLEIFMFLLGFLATLTVNQGIGLEEGLPAGNRKGFKPMSEASSGVFKSRTRSL